jgi:hypothetical protein
MNLSLNNIVWQEWTFRVGCWLLIGGVHLWLLFFLPKASVLSWADSAHRASSLMLQFVTAAAHRPANPSGSALRKVNEINEISKASVHKKTIINTVAKTFSDKKAN